MFGKRSKEPMYDTQDPQLPNDGGHETAVARRIRRTIPVAVIFLLHLFLYMGMASFTLRRNQSERLGTVMLPFFLYIALGVWGFPLILKAFREARAEERSRFGSLRLLALPALIVWCPATYLFGYEAWLHNIPLRHASNFGMALLLPASYHVFFTFVNPSRRGLWFGSGMAAGLLSWRFVMYAFGRMRETGGLSPSPALHFVYVVQILLVVLLTVALLYGLFVMPAGPYRERTPFCEPGAGGRGRRMAVWLFAAAACVYIMNGFLDIRLFPVLLKDAGHMFEPLQVVAVLSCPILGWWLDRSPGDGFRKAATACGVVFIIAPCLLAMDDTPLLYRMVHALTAAGQYAILILFTTVLADQPVAVERLGHYPAILFAWRMLSVICFVVVRNLFSIPTGAAVLMATLFAMAYYFLIWRLISICDGTRRNGQAAVSSSGANDGAVKASTAGNSSGLENFFAGRALSPRERQVAEMILQGLGTREMAHRLGLSENTVNTHVRKTLDKYGVSSRKALFALYVAADADSGA